MSKKKQRQTQQRTSQLRIIGGQWRGRKITFPTQISSLRPTGDRIRETLFNWLATKVRGAHCLDLFAGSGALGWEALSRGAAHCDFIDNSASVQNFLQAQSQTLGVAQQCRFFQQDALSRLNQAPQQQVDVVFIDPPFNLTSAAQMCVDLLIAQQWLAPQAHIYIEQPRDTEFVHHAELKKYRHQCSAQVQYGLLIHST